MKRIYVAGALNGDAETYIRNLHDMTDYKNRIVELGCAAYNPGADFLDGFLSGELSYEDYARNTMAFLEVCDAVAIVPNENTKNSLGTRKEVLRARELCIPVLYSLREVKNFLFLNEDHRVWALNVKNVRENMLYGQYIYTDSEYEMAKQILGEDG